MNDKEKPIFLLRENFFSNLWLEVGRPAGTVICEDGGKIFDAVDNGRRYCACWLGRFLLSMSNSMVRFIGEAHGTIAATTEDLSRQGWIMFEIDDYYSSKPLFDAGDIIVWKEKMIMGNMNRHIGFCWDAENELAISTCAYNRRVIVHDMTYQGKRKIEKIYWHPFLLH